MTKVEFQKACLEAGIQLNEEQMNQFEKYMQLLVEWNEKMNLTAITQEEEVWEKHFYDSIMPFSNIKFETMCDIGSGAGFPGIPVKIAFPHVHMTLVEPLQKRCRFLNEVKTQLNLDNLDILNVRAEDLAKEKRECFDVVSARAVAKLSILLELCVPFVKMDHTMVALKGKNGHEELINAQKAIDTLGVELIDEEKFMIEEDATRINLYFKKVKHTPNQKGGVGKTTTSINLASGLAHVGKKVLLIDFDSQGNATQGLNANQNNSQATIHSVLMEGVPIQQAIVPKMNPRIDIVPANINLAGADLDMDKMEAGKEELLKKAIAPIRDQYDYIIIDCPPSLGLLNTNALTAADSILIPVQCEYYALEGVTQLLITIRLVQRTSNRNLKIEGILLTMFDIRTRLSVEVSQDVRQTFGKLVYQNSIPRNVKLSEAPSRGMSIFEYDPKSTGAKAYAGLTEEVLKRNSREA